MRARIVALLLIVAAGLSTGVAGAQEIPFGDRPTAVEVAGAMLPCLDHTLNTATWVEGNVENAVLYVKGGQAMAMWRVASRPEQREALEVFWLDSDPISPPMTIVFAEPYPDGIVYQLSREERQSAAYCLEWASQR